jgi:DNA-binding transcriptional LysR family regulator
MRKLGFAEMNAFVAIAERSSFAKAAIHLGISRSALSETIRGLEEKLGVRLLNRTTRSVALTEVGERLLSRLRPALDSFEARWSPSTCSATNRRETFASPCHARRRKW